jgi:hypothetical protein
MIREENKIKTLVRILPGWLPLWETVGGCNRLVFLSPSLLAQYRALLRSARKYQARRKTA